MLLRTSAYNIMLVKIYIVYICQGDEKYQFIEYQIV